jgi:hypothetical protein
MQFDLVGREASRRFSAPEPPEIGFVALSLGILAACVHRARRRPLIHS